MTPSRVKLDFCGSFSHKDRLSIRILPATLTSKTIFQRFLEECQDFNLISDGEPVQPDAAEKLFTELPPDNSLANKYVLGLWHDQTLCGVVDLLLGYPESGICWIGLMLFSPTYRGQGLGKSTLDYLSTVLISIGIDRLQLGVLQENDKGRRFWQKQGFKELRRKENYKCGQKTHTVIVMEKSLPDQGIQSNL